MSFKNDLNILYDSRRMTYTCKNYFRIAIFAILIPTIIVSLGILGGSFIHYLSNLSEDIQQEIANIIVIIMISILTLLCIMAVCFVSIFGAILIDLWIMNDCRCSDTRDGDKKSVVNMEVEDTEGEEDPNLEGKYVFEEKSDIKYNSV